MLRASEKPPSFSGCLYYPIFYGAIAWGSTRGHLIPQGLLPSLPAGLAWFAGGGRHSPPQSLRPVACPRPQAMRCAHRSGAAGSCTRWARYALGKRGTRPGPNFYRDGRHCVPAIFFSRKGGRLPGRAIRQCTEYIVVLAERSQSQRRSSPETPEARHQVGAARLAPHKRNRTSSTLRPIRSRACSECGDRYISHRHRSDRFRGPHHIISENKLQVD